MIYVITGNDSSLLKREINKQVKEKLKEINDFNFVSFDMYNHLIQDAIDSCVASNLISEQKAVVCYNCYFLTDQEKGISSWTKMMDFDSLKKYLNNQNPDCDLYLTSIGKLDGDSNKLVELLKNNAKIETISTKNSDQLIDDGIRYVSLNEKTISKEAIIEVIRRVDKDYTLMINTLDKLMLYTSNIQLDDVYVLVADKLEEVSFNIVNNLFKFNVKDAIKSFRDLLLKGNEPLILFSQFSSQFKFLYQVSKKRELGYDDNKIAKELGCSLGRIYYSKKSIGRFQSKDILKMMADLNRMEIDMKYNLDNPKDSIEIFILNFKKNYYRKEQK